MRINLEMIFPYWCLNDAVFCICLCEPDCHYVQLCDCGGIIYFTSVIPFDM